MEILLTPQKYFNIKHFSDLRITSLEGFVNQLLIQKGLHRRKNLKEALIKLFQTSFAYSKMGYKSIGISSSTFSDLLVCSKQTVFNFLSDIKKYFSDIITIEKKIDQTGRFRNFFKVKTSALQQISDILTEEEHKQIEQLLESLNIKKSVNEVLQEIKKDKNLSNKELKKEIKQLLKKKEQFKQYLLQLFGQNINLEELKEKLKARGINNPDFIKTVLKMVKNGRDFESAIEMAKIKYSPTV